MAAFYTGTPGVQAERTATPRQLFVSDDHTQFFPSAKVIDGSLSRDTGHTGDLDTLRCGKLMGRVTSGGKYRPSIVGVLGTATTAATVTSITVPAAVATEFARLIAVAGGNVSAKLIGAPSATGTVAETAITVTAASGTTLTVSSVTTPVHIIGSFITLADGSEYPRCIIGKEDGIKVTDQDGTSQDNPPRAQ